MKIAVMQPYFLPSIGYFQLMEAVDVWVSMDHANLQKERLFEPQCRGVGCGHSGTPPRCFPKQEYPSDRD